MPRPLRHGAAARAGRPSLQRAAAHAAEPSRTAQPDAGPVHSLAQTPRLVAQRQRLDAVLGSCGLRPKLAPVRRLSLGLRPPGIAQRVNYPQDSTGSLDNLKTKVGTGEQEREVTGSALQEEILELARKAGNETGYRLASFELDAEDRLIRYDGTEEDHGMPALPKTFDTDPLDLRLDPFVRLTLGAAGQLKYITENAGEIFKTHRVIIDVDCQFDRTGQVGFHKDSRGTTAFVNLSFSNTEEMQGTEHYEDTEGDPGLEELLPKELQRDIEQRRVGYQGPDQIRAPRLPTHGRISFSDPSNYHSTPLLGHRQPFQGETLTYGYIYKVLDGMLPESEPLGKDKNHWVELYKKYVGDIYGSHGFEALSKRKDTAESKRNATKSRPRALSSALSSPETVKWLESQLHQARTFIRTWVRFVPR